MSLPLSHLALHNNGIGAVGAGHLARSLKDNSKLISLGKLRTPSVLLRQMLKRAPFRSCLASNARTTYNLLHLLAFVPVLDKAPLEREYAQRNCDDRLPAPWKVTLV